MKSAILFFLVVAPVAVGANYFEPSNRIAGIGVSRDDLSSDMIEVRTDHMVQSQTFTIMREPQALPGARRITGSDRLQLLFRKASESTGLPASIWRAGAMPKPRVRPGRKASCKSLRPPRPSWA